MNSDEREDFEIDLREIFHVLLSRLWIIVLAGLISGGIMGVLCRFIVTPIYTSTTQLCILSNETNIASLSDLAIGTQLTQDYVVVAQSRPVVEEVIRNLELDMTYEELLAATAMENPADTRILSISVTNPDPVLAKQIVDQYAQVSRKRIAELMDINEPGIIEEGHVAEIKTSPSTGRDVLAAGVLGAILAAAVIIVRYLMNDTIKSTEDIERYLGLNTLGQLPVEQGAVKEKQAGRAAGQAGGRRRKREGRKGGKKE